MTGAQALRAIRLPPWWRQRSPRERILLLVMALALGGYPLAVGLVRPVLVARADALASIARSDLALAQLAALPEAGDSAPRAEFADQPVTAIVTETAIEFGMAIRRIETEADGARLAIEDADFADVLRWIEALEAQYGLRLVAVEMDRRPEPGVVSAGLTVLR